MGPDQGNNNGQRIPTAGYSQWEKQEAITEGPGETIPLQVWRPGVEKEVFCFWSNKIEDFLILIFYRGTGLLSPANSSFSGLGDPVN